MKNKMNTMYDKARGVLLLTIILTIVNIIIFFTGGESLMLYSAIMPYFYSMVGYYSDLVFYYILAGVILIIYFLCWLFSKKNRVGLIVATVMFAIDCVYLLYLYSFEIGADVIVDYVIHGIIMGSLVLGIFDKPKKKNEEFDFSETSAVNNDHKHALRIAEDTKCKIFLEEEVLGKQVIYRRVKRVNELVINGKVYDEYEALVEMPHALYANIDDHRIEVGCNSASRIYLSVDGEVIKSKIRLI